MTGKEFNQKIIYFIKIFNNFEKYCMYDSEMEFDELQKKLKLQKQNPKMMALYGEPSKKIQNGEKS